MNRFKNHSILAAGLASGYSVLNRRIRLKWHGIGVIALMLVLANLTTLQAQQPNAPVIQSARVTLPPNQLTITGQNFGTETPTVSMNGLPLTVSSNTETTIVAVMPDAVADNPGSYALTVVNNSLEGNPAIRTATFNVTIVGAAGFDPQKGAQHTKDMTLSSPGFTSLFSWQLTGDDVAGARVFYTIVATDGGTQIATEGGVMQVVATRNSITCTVQAGDKLHLGTVNSGCTPGFFNPGSQPGVSIFDNVSFAAPAPIVTHKVYFTIFNISDPSLTLRLEP